MKSRTTVVTFAGINYLAVVVAAAVALVVSTAWYTILSGIGWRGETTKQAAEHDRRPGALLPNVCAVVAYLVMAFTLAGLLGHLGPGQVTVVNGAISGAFVWFGFVLTTMAVNYSFSNRGRPRLVIHAGNWLIVLIVMGAVIGAFGV